MGREREMFMDLERNMRMMLGDSGMAHTTWYFLALGVAIVFLLYRSDRVPGAKTIGVAGFLYAAALAVPVAWIFLSLALSMVEANTKAMAVVRQLMEMASWGLVAGSTFMVVLGLMPRRAPMMR